MKVSADGAIAVITREGASNRRNGFVILDVADPRNPEILSRFDDELTGGVHNVFLHEGHIYAINNGRRWDVINAERTPKNPFRVSRFEDLRPGRSVHDVWVEDGIAFQAGNTDGLVVVDVGGGGVGRVAEEPGRDGGGSTSSPAGTTRSGQFRSRSADRFYVVTGDESPPGEPANPRADHFLGGADAPRGRWASSTSTSSTIPRTRWRSPATGCPRPGRTTCGWIPRRT